MGDVRFTAAAGIIGLAALATISAAPARAEGDTLEGVYTRTITDSAMPSDVGKTATVVFTPCGPGCTNWQLEGNPGGFDMHLQGDKWFRQNATSIVIIDKNSLEGTASVMSDGLSSYMKFTLTPAP